MLKSKRKPVELTDHPSVLVLYGSPHPKGKTWQLYESFARTIPKNADITVYSAYKNRPSPCVDCGFCTRQDGCSQHDLDDFMRAFETCDIIVLVTPVYYNSFPAPLKAVIDRFQRYYSARFSRGIKPPIAKPRLAAVLATCGSDEREGLNEIKEQFKRAATVLNCTMAGAAFARGTDANGVPAKALESARRLGEKIFDRWLFE